MIPAHALPQAKYQALIAAIYTHLNPDRRLTVDPGTDIDNPSLHVTLEWTDRPMAGFLMTVAQLEAVDIERYVKRIAEKLNRHP